MSIGGDNHENIMENTFGENEVWKAWYLPPTDNLRPDHLVTIMIMMILIIVRKSDQLTNYWDTQSQTCILEFFENDGDDKKGRKGESSIMKA